MGKEKPIIFQPWAVAAILDGRKIQTIRPEQNGTYRPGDILWVRETWRVEAESRNYREGVCRVRCAYKAGYNARWWRCVKQRRTEFPLGQEPKLYAKGQRSLAWRPSIHMPKWASRLTLQVLEVRRLRLWDISEDDFLKDGGERLGNAWRIGSCFGESYKDAFAWLWNAMYHRKGKRWSDNPRAAAIRFIVILPERHAGTKESWERFGTRKSVSSYCM